MADSRQRSAIRLEPYLKALYKYPQAAFPYAQLVEEIRATGVPFRVPRRRDDDAKTSRKCVMRVALSTTKLHAPLACYF